MNKPLPYPVYDADNHLYESQEAMTAHLPRKWRKEFQYVEVNGRTKLAIGGQISEFIPNPTFDVLAAPGVHETWYRNANPEGLTLRELSGKPIACAPAYRNGADRLVLLDELGIHATLMFPTLASVVVIPRAQVQAANNCVRAILTFVSPNKVSRSTRTRSRGPSVKSLPQS